MKKPVKTSIKKLFLNKERVTILSNYQSSKILGGDLNIVPPIITVTKGTHV